MVVAEKRQATGDRFVLVTRRGLAYRPSCGGATRCETRRRPVRVLVGRRAPR